jgi:toxin ParE1/3/4
VARSVVFRPRAEIDLIALYDYIANAASPAVASGFIDRIEAACLSLATTPHRGTRRDDILRGLRTIGFERRVTIAFRVLSTQVEIITIAYAGRDWASTLGRKE